ncbi:MAG: hypothetical protein HQL32_01460 [Planctomycetes bacterium]|nr:hypothetical protein [Planctomycetota bacterium]
MRDLTELSSAKLRHFLEKYTRQAHEADTVEQADKATDYIDKLQVELKRREEAKENVKGIELDTIKSIIDKKQKSHGGINRSGRFSVIKASNSPLDQKKAGSKKKK